MGMTEKRCFMCGNFLIYKNGEFICLNCNCTISEDEYFNNDYEGVMND